MRHVLSEGSAALGLCADEHDTSHLGLSALPALAGDHGCTPGALRAMLMAAGKDRTHWIWNVLSVAGRTRDELLAAGTQAVEREDIRRRMHIELQLVDPNYLARALLDFSHFQLPRSSASTADLAGYLRVALSPGARANATASYVNYHVVAVRLAAMARGAEGPRADEWLARAFASEAFAEHFLEDSFASGHFVGHWGDDATRLGTHDYYSRTGLAATRWIAPSETFVAHGDGFLFDGEADQIAAAVSASLAQVLDAAVNESVAASLLADFKDALGEEEYDSCERAEVPLGLSGLSRSRAIQSVLLIEPVPAPRFPLVARIRAEKGVFAGGAASVATSYAPQPSSAEAQLRATVRVGFGAAGIVDDPLNSQAFLDAGFVGEHILTDERGNLTGYSLRLRGPGYLFVLDGVTALILADALEARCAFCLGWAAAAAGGGVGGIWKSHRLFGSVSWQFSALRDVSINWYRNEPRIGQSR